MASNNSAVASFTNRSRTPRRTAHSCQGAVEIQDKLACDVPMEPLQASRTVRERAQFIRVRTLSKFSRSWPLRCSYGATVSITNRSRTPRIIVHSCQDSAEILEKLGVAMFLWTLGGSKSSRGIISRNGCCKTLEELLRKCCDGAVSSHLPGSIL